MRFLSRRRAGVSSIVGSIFFVLIMVVAIASLVTIFNSFSSYNNAVNKADNANVQASDTELSITGSTLRVVPSLRDLELQRRRHSVRGHGHGDNQPKTSSSSPRACGGTFAPAIPAFQYSTSFDGVTWESVGERSQPRGRLHRKVRVLLGHTGDR